MQAVTVVVQQLLHWATAALGDCCTGRLLHWATAALGDCRGGDDRSWSVENFGRFLWPETGECAMNLTTTLAIKSSPMLSAVKAIMKHVLLILLLAIHLPAMAQSGATASELAKMDAAATMLGSIGSWIRNEPEAAIDAFVQHDAVKRYALSARENHSSTSRGRIKDRMAQLASGLDAWDDAIERLHREAPQQIATELKRQRDAVARYKKSKYSRPSSFAYIPKNVWKTKDKLAVLTASGFDTTALIAEQERVQADVLALIGSMDAEQLAKSNGRIRDGYKQSDRSSIEAYVNGHWADSSPGKPAEAIVMPSQAWSRTYSAKANANTGQVTPWEVERMTVYVVVSKSDALHTMYPVRLQRVAGEIQSIPINEFSFDVLKN